MAMSLLGAAQQANANDDDASPTYRADGRISMFSEPIDARDLTDDARYATDFDLSVAPWQQASLHLQVGSLAAKTDFVEARVDATVWQGVGLALIAGYRNPLLEGSSAGFDFGISKYLYGFSIGTVVKLELLYYTPVSALTTESDGLRSTLRQSPYDLISLSGALPLGFATLRGRVGRFHARGPTIDTPLLDVELDGVNAITVSIDLAFELGAAELSLGIAEPLEEVDQDEVFLATGSYLHPDLHRAARLGARLKL